MHTYEIGDLTKYEIEVHLAHPRRTNSGLQYSTTRFPAHEVTYAETPSGSLSIRMRTPAEAPADGPEITLFARGEWHQVALVRRPQTPEEARAARAEMDEILRRAVVSSGNEVQS